MLQTDGNMTQTMFPLDLKVKTKSSRTLSDIQINEKSKSGVVMSEVPHPLCVAPPPPLPPPLNQ